MEFVNFVEVVLDDDEDEGTEASELFFFRYWYDICTSSLLLYSLTLSLFLSYSLSPSLSLLPARDTRISLSGKNNFEKLQNISNFLLARCCLSLSPLERRRMATPTRIRTASMVVPPSSLLKSSKKRKSLSESLRSKRRHQRVKVVSFNENGFMFVESALDATLTSAIALSVLYSYYYISSSSNVMMMMMMMMMMVMIYARDGPSLLSSLYSLFSAL